ncbi:hypothetical protein [Lysinibacillus xylanilyticus]|uniref:hypothetical protein n=1 Tax=Lysinibacillus xylanilyticus TaxID=582475 RepID=UPI003CFC74DE
MAFLSVTLISFRRFDRSIRHSHFFPSLRPFYPSLSFLSVTSTVLSVALTLLSVG